MLALKKLYIILAIANGVISIAVPGNSGSSGGSAPDYGGNIEGWSSGGGGDSGGGEVCTTSSYNLWTTIDQAYTSTSTITEEVTSTITSWIDVTVTSTIPGEVDTETSIGTITTVYVTTVQVPSVLCQTTYIAQESSVATQYETTETVVVTGLPTTTEVVVTSPAITTTCITSLSYSECVEYSATTSAIPTSTVVCSGGGSSGGSGGTSWGGGSGGSWGSGSGNEGGSGGQGESSGWGSGSGSESSGW